MRANLALFTYKVTDQQVGSTTPQATQITSNAASSRSKGIELDANWRTPIDGISLRGGGAYIKARYLSYADAPCYGGQTQSLGCRPISATAFAQDLSGSRIPRTPSWAAFVGGTAEFGNRGGITYGLNADANYSSGYFASGTNAPSHWQGSYWLVDASAFVRRGPWEASLIGRNLTNTYYFQRIIDAPGTSAVNATRTQSVLADIIGSVSRGREIWVKIGYQFQ